jgi:peptidyl-prolyl cis-trans isomerase A (cyclophilin A)
MRTIRPTLRIVLTLLASCLGLAAAPVSAETINPVVRFTVFGAYSFDVELFENETAATVANFLSYVEGGSYTNSIIHRSTTSNPTDIQVLQGGSFYLGPNGLSTIATGSPIALQAGLPNLRGTLAMARTTAPDSATSGWFINVTDNPELDPSLEPFNAGYAVFGRVVPDVLPPLNPSLSGMALIDALASLQIYPQNIDVWTGTGYESVGFPQLPLLVEDQTGYYVTVNSIAPVPEPSTLVLAGVGLAAAITAARRPRRAAR